MSKVIKMEAVVFAVQGVMSNQFSHIWHMTFGSLRHSKDKINEIQFSLKIPSAGSVCSNYFFPCSR